MNIKAEQFPALNSNPVLSVAKDGKVTYSNKAGEPLLREWGVRVGEKLPSCIVDLVQGVISRNSPEKIEVNLGKKLYLIVLHPLPEKECVNISGLDISNQKKLEEKLRLLNEELEVKSRELSKVKEDLRKSETKYWNLIENSQEGIWIIDRNDRTIYVNKKVSEMLGYSIDEIIGQSPKKFLASEFRTVADDRLCEHRQRVRQAIDYRFIRKDGSDLWCIVSTHQLFDNEGKYNGSLGMLIDITERKKAEEDLKRVNENLEERVKERTAELEKAYNSLKESEKGLSEAQRMAHIGNWVWDIATDKAYWSNELYRIFGRDPKKLAPTIDEFHSYIHPDDRLDYVNMADKALNEKSSLSIDFRIISDDGEERRIDMQSEIILNETNDPVQIKGIVHDITERKKAEEKIHHLANVVESSSDAIGTLSLEGITTSWNKGAEQIYGYTAEEILGQHISLPAPSHLKDETQKYVELIKQTGMSYRYITSRLRKDGEMIEVSVTLSPVYDNLGKLSAISFISRDITEQKRSEEKLRQSEEKYRNIVETANEGISLIDSEGNVIYVNKKLADMLEYSPEEFIGRPTWDFVATEDVLKNKSEIEKRRLGVSESYEIKLIRKSGSSLWVFINAKSIFDENGKFIGSLSMHTDITKRKEAEEALNNIEIARKKEIHHRIKNNLQVISSLLDLQADKFKDRGKIRDSEVQEAFRESQNRVKSMALIHEELHKGEGFEKLNFSSYIKELADNLFLTYSLGNNDINLNMELDKNVFFDMDIAIPFGIIINELVSNSLKYAFPERSDGEIQIKLCREEDSDTSFILSVSDNGIGISKDINIKDIDSLGLQLVTSLVDQLDGELELKRDNGTEFIIRFKVAENNKTS
jgi:PAS domain S-box-containing protein